MTTAVSRTLASVLEGKPNLTFEERAAYVAVGLGLAAAGAKPRPNPILNVIALAGGAYIAWSGYKGHCPVKAALVDHTVPAPESNRIAGGTQAPAGTSL